MQNVGNEKHFICKKGFGFDVYIGFAFSYEDTLLAGSFTNKIEINFANVSLKHNHP